MDAKTTHSSTSLFKTNGPSPAHAITFQFEDHPITAPAGVSIAAALLLEGVGPFRATAITSAPRAPYCMMGVCFECLVQVDGVPNRQACLMTIQEGMVVARQLGAAALTLGAQGGGDEH